MRGRPCGHADNRCMPRLAYLLLVLTLAAAACTPSLNWRVVHPGGELKALLPCKPDEARRPQRLAGHPLSMHMLGCEADGGLFVLASVELESSGQAAEIQAQWQQAMQSSVGAQMASMAAFKLKGADGVFPPTKVQLKSNTQEGRALEAQSVWFVHGRHLYQAAVYAEKMREAMTEPFFSGLELP